MCEGDYDRAKFVAMFGPRRPGDEELLVKYPKVLKRYGPGVGMKEEKHDSRESAAQRTPTAEWLERQIAAFQVHGARPSQRLSKDLATHLLNNWLQVESLEVEMLVRAARTAKAALEQRKQANNEAGNRGRPVILLSSEPHALERLEEALAPFDKP